MDRLNENECVHTCGVFSLLGGAKSGKSSEENEDLGNLGATSTNDRELNSKRNALLPQPQQENVVAISDWDQDVHSPPNRPNGSGDEEKIIPAVDMETSKRIKALEEALQKQMTLLSETRAVIFEKKDKGLEDKLEVIGALLKENNKIALESSLPAYIEKFLRNLLMAYIIIFLSIFFIGLQNRYQYDLNQWYRKIYTMIFN